MFNGELLDAVAAEVKACRKCELWKTRKNAVPGEGSSKGQIIFIGEAPGRWEDIEGRPFVGAAGKFLDTLLSMAGLSREDIFIGNILKCRPPRNRQPLSNEIEACTPYLDRQIQAIHPQLIVTLGTHSTAYIFSKVNLPFKGITHVHGKPCQASLLNMQATIFPTFHPAAALYQRKYRERSQNDFQKLRQFLTDDTLPLRL